MTFCIVRTIFTGKHRGRAALRSCLMKKPSSVTTALLKVTTQGWVWECFSANQAMRKTEITDTRCSGRRRPGKRGCPSAFYLSSSIVKKRPKAGRFRPQSFFSLCRRQTITPPHGARIIENYGRTIDAEDGNGFLSWRKRNGLSMHAGEYFFMNPDHKLNCVLRSEERRVGKECRSRWSPDH